MKNIKINKNTILFIIEYLSIITIVLQFNTVWASFYSCYKVFSNVLLIINLLLSFLYFLLLNKGRKNISNYCSLCFCIILFFSLYYVFSLINGAQLIQYVKLMLLFISMFSLWYFRLKNCDNDIVYNFFKKFINVMVLYGIISFVLWLFIPVLSILNTNQVYESSWGAVGTYNEIFYGWNNIYFYKKAEIFFGTNVVRNVGIFTEAPMYSFLLSTALLLNLFFIKKSKHYIIKNLLLIVTIISTLSSTGIIIVILAILFKLLSNKSSKILMLTKSMIPLILVLSFSAIIFLFNQKINSSSGLTRVDDFKIGFYALKDSFFVGGGYQNSSFVERYLSQFRVSNNGISNSLTAILVYGGLMLFIPYLLAFLRAYYYSYKHKNFDAFIFVLLFSMMFLITNVPFKCFSFLILLCICNESLFKKKSINNI